MSYISEGICERCGGDYYLHDDYILTCETCGYSYNVFTGEILENGEED